MRLLFWFLIIALFIVLGSTVNLGRRTLFGHIANIWRSEEASEMKEDVKTGTKPALEKVKRAGKAAVQELKTDRDAGAAIPGTAPRRR